MQRKPPSIFSKVLPIVLLLAAGTVFADDDSGKPVWSFGGFATVGAVHADAQQADFTSTVLAARGAGFSRSVSPDADTRLGAQLGVSLNPQWSAVLQVISEYGIENSYQPVVEWANVKYQATPDLSIRFGRIALPMLLAADYRKVAYTLAWVRTPVEVYGAIPITHSDGIDVTYRWRAGEFKNLTQVFYGRNKVKVNDTINSQARQVAGISHTIELGAASLRLGYQGTNLTIDIARPLFDGLRQFGPQGAALAERYAIDHKRVIAYNIGANYDPGNWFAMAELVRIDSQSFLGDKTAWYASSGYRFGQLTPYLSYARAKSNGPTQVSGLGTQGLPPAYAGAAQALNAGLNGLLSMIAVQHTASVGIRWDVARDMALKLQYDRVMPKDGSSGMLINVQPGFKSGQTINVVSATLDFVF
jgi:hypothetical protein